MIVPIVSCGKFLIPIDFLYPLIDCPLVLSERLYDWVELKLERLPSNILAESPAPEGLIALPTVWTVFTPFFAFYRWELESLVSGVSPFGVITPKAPCFLGLLPSKSFWSTIGTAFCMAALSNIFYLFRLDVSLILLWLSSEFCSCSVWYSSISICPSMMLPFLPLNITPDLDPSLEKNW